MKSSIRGALIVLASSVLLSACSDGSDRPVPVAAPSLPEFCDHSIPSTQRSADGSALAQRWEERTISWAKRVSFEEIQDVFLLVEGEDPFRSDDGSWTYEFRAAACELEKHAIKLADNKEHEAALLAYRKAAELYDIARFPALVTPEREAIYRRMEELYVYFTEASGNPVVQRERFTYNGQSIEGFLQVPSGADNPPLVIMTGGLDTWKTSYERYLERMWNAGFATFIFDMPGTGSNPLILNPDGDKVYSAAIKHFMNRDGINGGSIGVYTISFSGSIGLELALTNKDVRAVVDNCGGAHYLYAHQPNVIVLPAFNLPNLAIMQQALLWTLGFRENMLENRDGALAVWENDLPKLSLVNQGLLPVQAGAGANKPLLHIHGVEDSLVDIEDYDIVGQMGVVREELLYPDDFHCAPLNFDDHIARSVEFFQRYL